MSRNASRTALGAVAWLVSAPLLGCGGVVDQDAETLLMKQLGKASVTVFPAFCRYGDKSEYDDAAAKRIAEFLETEKFARATVSTAHVPITGPWHGNQAKMLRESSEAFIAYLAEHPVETDYALLPEYLFGRSEARGVHGYVIDRNGKVAEAELLNSHHKPFSEAKPKTPGDCTGILIKVLRMDFRRGGS